MAKVTRIKASDGPRGEADGKKPPKDSSKKALKTASKEAVAPQKTGKKTETMPKWLRIITWPFRMLAVPFIALGRYLKASWQELRQVRWPSRGATWKMLLAVLVYTAIFIIFIMLLDALFTLVFNKLLG